MAALSASTRPQGVLGPFVVKTQDFEKLGELGRGACGLVLSGNLKIATKVLGAFAAPRKG